MKIPVIIGLFLVCLGACETWQTADSPGENIATATSIVENSVPKLTRETGLTVSSVLIGMSGQSIGTVALTPAPKGILISAQVRQGGLSPGWHGLHLHSVGDCSDVGIFKRSGGHVGMIEGGHGLLNPLGPEVGDIPNIWAAQDGSAGYETFTNLIEMHQIRDLDGTALIIHQNADDHITQPIGGAGPRVACAVIIKKP